MSKENNAKIYNALLEFYNVNEKDNVDVEEKSVMDYILGEGITEADGQEILNRFLKVLKSTKRGVITATVMASLMSNVAFSSAVQQAPENVKSQITQIMNTGGGNGEVKQSSESELMINFSNNFESGTFDIDPNEVYAKLGELKEFFANNGTSFKIKILASESQVPNQGNFKIGDLAKKRASIMSSLVKNYLEKNGIHGMEVDVSTNVGDTPWDGKNKDDNKYTNCLLYTSPSPRDRQKSRMPSSA